MDDLSKDKLIDVTADKTGITLDDIVRDIKSNHEEAPNEQYKNVDLSFLRPIAMKRKVVDMFSKATAHPFKLPSS